MGLLLVVLFFLGVRGCLNARKESALKDYAGDSAELVRESDQQSGQLFRLLSGTRSPEQTVDVENSLNAFRNQSAQLVDRARATDRPDQMSRAQRFLLETLEFRRDGLAAIADALPMALSDQGRQQGTNKIAAEMRSFLASDVIYSQRFVPNLRRPLNEEGLLDDVRIARSRFLSDIAWLDPAKVRERISGIRSGRRRTATPGIHGNSLVSVSLGGETLTQTGSTTVQISRDVSFKVQVSNQGESTETEVPVRVTVGRGPRTIELEKVVDELAAGRTDTVEIPLAETPPTGQALPVKVVVEPVPGEQKKENNEQTFSVIFTR